MTWAPQVLAMALLLPSTAFAGEIRRVVNDGTEVIPVHLRVGEATALELPAPATSVALGDPGGFRVETLERLVLVKPLRAGGRSNLLAHTARQVFTVQLGEGTGPAGDYRVVVALPPAREAVPGPGGPSRLRLLLLRALAGGPLPEGVRRVRLAEPEVLADTGMLRVVLVGGAIAGDAVGYHLRLRNTTPLPLRLREEEFAGLTPGLLGVALSTRHLAPHGEADAYLVALGTPFTLRLRGPADLTRHISPGRTEL